MAYRYSILYDRAPQAGHSIDDLPGCGESFSGARRRAGSEPLVAVKVLSKNCSGDRVLRRPQAILGKRIVLNNKVRLLSMTALMLSRVSCYHLAKCIAASLEIELFSGRAAGLDPDHTLTLNSGRAAAASNSEFGKSA